MFDDNAKKEIIDKKKKLYSIYFSWNVIEYIYQNLWKWNFISVNIDENIVYFFMEWKQFIFEISEHILQSEHIDEITKFNLLSKSKNTKII